MRSNDMREIEGKRGSPADADAKKQAAMTGKRDDQHWRARLATRALVLAFLAEKLKGGDRGT